MNKKLLFAALLSVAPFAYGMEDGEHSDDGISTSFVSEELGSDALKVNDTDDSKSLVVKFKELVRWEMLKGKFNLYDVKTRSWCDKNIVEKLTQKLNGDVESENMWTKETVAKYLKWIAGSGFGLAGFVTLCSAYNDTFEDEDEETHNKRAFVKALLGLGLIGSGAYVVFSGDNDVEMDDK